MRRYSDSRIFAGPAGTTKVMIQENNGSSSHESFQLVNNNWILRDVWHTPQEAVADAIHGAGLNPNPSKNLFDMLPMLRNPMGEELFDLLPMLRRRKNPLSCCSECSQPLNP